MFSEDLLNNPTIKGESLGYLFMYLRQADWLFVTLVRQFRSGNLEARL